MNKNFILIGLVFLALVILGFVYTQQSNNANKSNDYIPGTMCKTDSDCKFVKWTKEGQSGSLCAVPDEYAKFFGVSVEADNSKECYCRATRDLGPINVCAPK